MHIHCHTCGAVLKRPPSRVYEHNFCSRECQRKWWAENVASRAYDAKARNAAVAKSNSENPRRKSKLSDEQWSELLSRARGGQSVNSLSIAYGVGRTQIRRELARR